MKPYKSRNRVTFDKKSALKGLYTLDIFAHNIAIKR